MENLDDLIRRVAAAAQHLADTPCAVALGGSLAKGVADAQSDLDIYVFAQSWLPDGARTAVIQQALGPVTRLRSWSAPPEQAGTDFAVQEQEVEIWLRQLGPIADIVERSVRGEVVRRYVRWTPNGFYEHAALADLTSLKVIADPHGLLSPLLDQLQSYPHALRRSLIEHGLASARFWRGNFHLETALARADGYYLQSIAQQIAADLVQALFAANETYFPGDKKLHVHLGKLAWHPDGFETRLDGALLGQAGWRARFDDLFGLADEIEARASF